MSQRPNRRQFLRQTAAFGLAAGLLPSGLLTSAAAAQDLSTLEARAAWLNGQFRGHMEGPNAKFGAAVALARLALNPADEEVISYIAGFYDNVPEGSNGQQFSYPGVAWVLGKYWDQFTSEQLDGLKAKIKDFSDLLGHGTENHAMMKCVAAYLFAQYWPGESGWVRGAHTSDEVMETARERLLSVIGSLYDRGYEENLSTTYAAVHLFPYYALYDCATDPEIKSAASAALHFHVTNIAANHFEGIVIPPYNRQNAWQTNTHTPGFGYLPALQWIYWLYWAEAQNRIPVGEDFIQTSENRYAVYAAVSDWTPPAAINSLARGETVPYELTASAPSFRHANMGPSRGHWGTGTPGTCVRYVYRDTLYAMGSGYFRYYPDQFYVDYNAFGLIYKSPDKYNYIECYHPYWRSNDRTWQGLNSPFMQMAQHKGTAIVLFNIPNEDPWAGRGRSDWQEYRDDHFDNLIQEALVRYPKSIGQQTEADGWIFLREGAVYIAIRPLKDYTIDTDYAEAGEFDVIRCASAQTGYVFDIATEEEFATFEAFQTAVKDNPPAVDWEKLSVAYTNAKGDTLTAAWNPPNYDAEEERVLVRPDITVNGDEVPIDSDFPRGEAVIKSPSVELADRVLQLQTPAGRLEVEAPEFSKQ